MMRYWALFFLFALQGLEAREIVYLSWQSSPDSSIIVHRIVDAPSDTKLSFRKKGSEEWRQESLEEINRPDFLPNRIQHALLSDLEEDSLYEFRFEEGPSSLFRTAPKSLDKKVSIVFGGDLYHDSLEAVKRMNQVVAQLSPLSAVLGGDLAYSYARSYQRKESTDRWLSFLEIWSKTMVTAEGVVIPMVVAIGNHEVISPFSIPFSQAPLFFDLFAMEEGKSYRKIAFGNWLALFILDSGHAQSITGGQWNWLSKEAANSLPFRYKVAVYHVPAWPSYRPLSGGTSIKVRKNWAPLFEKMGLDFAFENHDHLYKRTYPLLHGNRDEDGVIYIGSGGWGGANHLPHERRPYLAKTVAVQSVVLLQFSWQGITLQAISDEGKVIDEIDYSH